MAGLCKFDELAAALRAELTNEMTEASAQPDAEAQGKFDEFAAAQCTKLREFFNEDSLEEAEQVKALRAKLDETSRALENASAQHTDAEARWYAELREKNCELEKAQQAEARSTKLNEDASARLSDAEARYAELTETNCDVEARLTKLHEEASAELSDAKALLASLHEERDTQCAELRESISALEEGTSESSGPPSRDPLLRAAQRAEKTGGRSTKWGPAPFTGILTMSSDPTLNRVEIAKAHLHQAEAVAEIRANSAEARAATKAENEKKREIDAKTKKAEKAEAKKARLEKALSEAKQEVDVAQQLAEEAKR